MPLLEALRLALQAIWSSKLRSFFTLLGIIVSVGFLVVVVAIIQGMNAYVRDTLTSSMIGTNTFQVRRGPISIGLLDDEQVRAIAKRPLVTVEDAETVGNAIPDAVAVALQSGWPTPVGEVSHRDRNVINVLVFGVTPPYQMVQDYRFLAGGPLTEPDLDERRPAAVLGYEIAEKLFDEPAAAVGKRVRLDGHELTVRGVIAPKGRLLGQSFDAFVLLPFPVFEAVYGRRKTTVVSVKMASAEEIDGAMARAEEAMRVAHRLRQVSFHRGQGVPSWRSGSASPPCSSPPSRRWWPSGSSWAASSS
jgi:putative ABC transport system permease protein